MATIYKNEELFQVLPPLHTIVLPVTANDSPITQDEMLSWFAAMKNNKVLNANSISYETIKGSFYSLLDSWVLQLNHCYSKGLLPKQFKLSSPQGAR